MVAVLFFVGRHFEQPTVVSDLLDCVEKQDKGVEKRVQQKQQQQLEKPSTSAALTEASASLSSSASSGGGGAVEVAAAAVGPKCPRKPQVGIANSQKRCGVG
jgi:hypothetical protein